MISCLSNIMQNYLFVFLQATLVLGRSLQSEAASADITIAILDSQQFEMQNEFIQDLFEKYAETSQNLEAKTNITVQTTKFENYD